MAVSSNVERIKGKPTATAVVVRAHAAITTPFTRKLSKSKGARGAKLKQQRQEQEEQQREQEQQQEHQHQQQQQLSQQRQHQQRPPPLRYRVLPLVVSGAALQGLSFCFGASTPRGDRVLFALLCFLGGGAAVEACRSAIVFSCGGDQRQRQSLAAAAVNHLRSNASRYVASFLTVVILQAVWSETQRGGDEKQQQRHQSQPDVPLPYRSALSFLAVLSAAVALQLVAPYLGAFLVRQPDDVQPASLVLLRDSAPPCGPRWAWKTVKGCFVTSVVLGLCIAAAVLSGGGGVLVGLGMTHSVVSAGREALPVIRKGWLRRRMSRRKGSDPKASPADAAAAAAAPPSPSPPAQAFSLESVILSARAGPTRTICSPVVLPAFLLWATHSTICSWPQECTDRLALLLRVMATSICVMHLVRAPTDAESEAAASAKGNGSEQGDAGGGGGGGGDGTIWPYKVFVGACALAAWTFLLLTSLIVLDRQREDSPEGLIVMVLVATMVALRTPHEKSWRGLMLVFWAALLAVLVNAAASKLTQQNKVFHRIFYDYGRGAGGGGSALTSYLRAFRAVAQLRQEGRVALWTVCPSRASSVRESAHGAHQSWFGSWSS